MTIASTSTSTSSVGRRPTSRSTTPYARTARRLALAGWAVSVLVGLFLAFDATLHLVNLPVVQQGSARLGFAPGIALTMGLSEAFFLLLYLWPRTSVLGAVLLSTYLGGAFTAQLRVEAPLFSTLLFPVYVAVLGWAGLWLRDARVRALVPLRRS